MNFNQLEQFIDEHKEELLNNDFKTIYSELDAYDSGDLTEILNQSGIYPEAYLKPEDYEIAAKILKEDIINYKQFMNQIFEDAKDVSGNIKVVLDYKDISEIFSNKDVSADFISNLLEYNIDECFYGNYMESYGVQDIIDLLDDRIYNLDPRCLSKLKALNILDENNKIIEDNLANNSDILSCIASAANDAYLQGSMNAAIDDLRDNIVKAAPDFVEKVTLDPNNSVFTMNINPSKMTEDDLANLYWNNQFVDWKTWHTNELSRLTQDGFEGNANFWMPSDEWQTFDDAYFAEQLYNRLEDL